MAGTSKHKPGFYVGVTCPGCGGQLELKTGFFATECSFCGSVLRVVMPDVPPAFLIHGRKEKREIRFQVDRYLKENRQPLTRSDFHLRRIYYPYWKLDAIRLKIREKQEPKAANKNIMTAQLHYGGWAEVTHAIHSALVDKSIGPGERKLKVSLSAYTATARAGPEIKGVPYSIGLRSEYIGVVPFSAERIGDDFECVPVVVPWAEICAKQSKSMAAKSKLHAGNSRVYRSEIFRPAGSVIYFPYYILDAKLTVGINRFILDGVSGRIVHTKTLSEPESITDFSQDCAVEFGQLSVEFHRCFNCGTDLPAGKSHLYICRDCNEIITPEKNLLLKNNIYYAESKDSKSDNLFPFWLLGLSGSEAARLASLSESSNPPEQLIIPAFVTSNFDAIRRLSRRLTAARSQIETKPARQFDRRFMPVTVGLTEALTHAEIIIYCEKAKINPDLSADSFKIKPENIRLLYLPFHPEHYFYVDSIIGSVTFEKSLVE